MSIYYQQLNNSSTSLKSSLAALKNQQESQQYYFNLVDDYILNDRLLQNANHIWNIFLMIHELSMN